MKSLDFRTHAPPRAFSFALQGFLGGSEARGFLGMYPRVLFTAVLELLNALKPLEGTNILARCRSGCQFGTLVCNLLIVQNDHHTNPSRCPFRCHLCSFITSSESVELPSYSAVWRRQVWAVCQQAYHPDRYPPPG